MKAETTQKCEKTRQKSKSQREEQETTWNEGGHPHWILIGEDLCHRKNVFEEREERKPVTHFSFLIYVSCSALVVMSTHIK